MVLHLLWCGIQSLLFIIGLSAAGHSISWLFIICFAAMVPLLAWFIERAECGPVQDRRTSVGSKIGVDSQVGS
jgi:hypothetical protein